MHAGMFYVHVCLLFLYPTNLIQMCIKLFFRCFAIAFFLAKAIMVSNLELKDDEEFYRQICISEIS